MTVEQFVAALKAFTCVSEGFIDQMINLADQLSPAVRVDIVEELKRGEAAQLKILEQGIKTFSTMGHKLQKEIRQETESDERNQEAKTISSFSL